MTDGTPIACSLGASELQQRVNEISEAGADSLIERSTTGDRHLLRFRSDAKTRRNLEAIIAAEAKCCSFLDLSLDEQGDQLLLSIGATEGGEPIAEGLAASFERGSQDSNLESPVLEAVRLAVCSLPQGH